MSLDRCPTMRSRAHQRRAPLRRPAIWGASKARTVWLSRIPQNRCRASQVNSWVTAQTVWVAQPPFTVRIDLGDVSPCDAIRPEIIHGMFLGFGEGSEPHPAEALSAAIRTVPDAPKRTRDFRGAPLMKTANCSHRHRRPENGSRRCGSELPLSMFLAAARTADKVLGIARVAVSSFELLTRIEAPVGSASADAVVSRNGVADMLILIARRPDGFRVACAKMTRSSPVLFS